jgi:hypothetical protein
MESRFSTLFPEIFRIVTDKERTLEEFIIFNKLGKFLRVLTECHG